MKQSIKMLITAGLLSVCSLAQAGPLDYYYFHKLDKARSLRAPQTVQTGYYTQLIDHHYPGKGTFSQRYYLDETYGPDKNAPVFFYICGEATCYSSSLNGAIREAAKKYHAKLVALEHRYYGRSLPTQTFSTNDLRYLTTINALLDLAEFEKFMIKSKEWKGKWIAFGGSYPGSLSAYYRLHFPELVAGALASSAPVEARENFEEYDAHVTKVAGPVCAEKMRAANRAIEAVSADSQRMTEFKRAFKVEGLRNDTDFLFFVADIGAAAVQYGYKDTFCKMLEESADPVTGYAKFAEYFYRAWGIDDPVSLAIQGAESENPADYADGLGMRQWFYQSCLEYGYWQNAHHDPEKSTRSAEVNAAYFRDVCTRLFGIKTGADTDVINAQFYYPLFRPDATRIFLTNGSNDPWSKLSMTEENGNVVNKNLSYYTIDGAAHCEDLHASRGNDSASLKTAREKLSALLSEWLA